MDINIINDTIEELEQDKTTFENIQELACLYIVKSNLESKNITTDRVTQELNDILPCYKRYTAIKRDYQLGRATDDLLLDAMQDVCIEIKEFIESLYFNTEFLKERLRIKNMINNLQSIDK